MDSYLGSRSPLRGVPPQVDRLSNTRDTARELARFEPDCLIPMHCSGETFFEAAKQALPGKVVRTSTGTRFDFTAPGSPAA